MNFKSVPIQILCLVIFTSCATCQDIEPLKWKFKQGDAFEVSLSQATNINSKIDQRVKDVNSKLVLSMEWTVESVDDSTGNATITQSIDRVQLEMLSLPMGAGKPVNIDTGSDENKKGFEAKLLKQLGPLVGVSYEVIMSPLGEIVDVTVPEKTLEAIRKAPGSLRLRQLLSKPGLNDLFGQSAVVLPDSAPSSSTPWTVKNTITTEAGTYDRQHSYQWTGNRQDNGKTLADIKMSTTITPAVDDKTTAPDVKFVSFEGNGDLEMNVTDGHFTSTKTVNKMQTEKSYREKTIITTVTSTIEMQVNKK